MSSDDQHVISTGFDLELLTLGKWSIEERNKFHEWTDQRNYEIKRKKAGELLTYFILTLLSEDCSFEGRSKIQHLYNVVSNLENLVYTTRDISNKFYRDHINHSIKVSLLSKAISTIKPFKLNDVQTKHLLLSCLFHDISYPLSDSVKIFDTTINALKDCYFSAEFFRSNFIKRTIVDKKKLAEYLDVTETVINTMIEDMDHGLFSAIEFISYLNNPNETVNKYKNIIKSIALHDSKHISKVDIIKNPVLGILIIADELQDWGRSSVIINSIIPRIEDFELIDGKISGRFSYNPDPNYSTFKQICGKISNFKRLILNPEKINFEIIFDVNCYNKIDLEKYSNLLTQLYINLNNNHFLDPNKNIPFYELTTYEKMTYGINTTSKSKRLIYDLLLKNSLNLIFPLNEHFLYINDLKKEMIISKLDLTDIKHIIFNNNENNSIQTYLKINNHIVKCNVSDERQTSTFKIYDIFITTIRYINYLNYILSGSFDKLTHGSIKIEGSCSPDLLRKVSQNTNIINFINKYDELKINSIMDSMRKGNFFLII